jgi:hypothetical protein
MQVAERRLGQSFARNVGVERGSNPACHRQAAPLHAHAVAQIHASGVERGRVDRQFKIAALLEISALLESAALRFDREDPTACNDNTGEHRQALLGVSTSRKSLSINRWSRNSKRGRRRRFSNPTRAAKGGASIPRKCGAT